jgi:predicted acyl esterase
VRCPVYAIGGWADGYSNAVGRLLEGLSVPRKGLIGPWSHAYPHNGLPGPAIGFLQEAMRWWDHWLKGIDTGIMDEPMFRVWMQDSVRPEPQYQIRPGRWIAEPSWPSPRIESLTLTLTLRGSLAKSRGTERRLKILSPPMTGLASGSWCAFGRGDEMPTDQRVDDNWSLVFDSEPLRQPLEIFGTPRLRLVFDSDRAVAQAIVRLNDVFPDGTSALVSYGVLNLCHRNSHEFPAPLVPGERSEATIKLNDLAHCFPAGHRLRIAIATSYWPLVWPAPEPVTLGIYTGASALDLPMRPPQPEDAELQSFAGPEEGPRESITVRQPSTRRRTIERDPPSGNVVCRVFSEGGEFHGAALVYLEDIDLTTGFSAAQTYQIGASDPLSAKAAITAHAMLQRKSWTAAVRATVELQATKDSFIVTAQLTANEGNAEIIARTWEEKIARDLL